jgi:hypothetical protein
MLNLEPIKERLNIILSDIPEWVVKDLQQLTEELERTRFLLKLKDERVEELKRKLNEQTVSSEESIYIGDFNGYKYYLAPSRLGYRESWQKAQDYCASLTIDGYSDWYLPNKEELNFLFQNVSGKHFISSNYWSSSEYLSPFAWAQNFLNGFQGTYDITTLASVCAIRKEKLKEESVYVGDFEGYRYFLSPKNTEHLKTWQEAKNYCSSLAIDGHNDWYLPTKDELNFLYKNKDSLHLGEGFIPTTYWSSTEDSSADAWEQYFVNGIQNLTTKRFLLYARAIRKEKI